jgi:drug/metabolite transporter (DMT)-like permease
MKPMLQRYDSIVLVAWAYVFGAGFILISVLTCATSSSDWHFSHVAAGAIVYSALFSSALAYGLMAWVNQRSTPLVVSAFYPVQPVVTVLLSWAVLGQKPSSFYYIGGLFVVAGLFTLLWTKSVEAGSRAGHTNANEDDADKDFLVHSLLQGGKIDVASVPQQRVAEDTLAGIGSINDER